MTDPRTIRLTIGSLFAGVGGLELGLEWAGLGPVVWQAESDEWCRRVLATHWPEAVRYDDVRAIDEQTETVDVICGGFPCTDISSAGRRAGIEGQRSGLWSEFSRVIGVLRPRFAIVENPAALLVRGMGTVLGDLARMGYDAEWHCIPAAAVGAPHLRARVWILAYPAGFADGAPDGRICTRGNTTIQSSWWAREPYVERVADGVSVVLDHAKERERALGNAVVPQCAEAIGRAIAEVEKEQMP